MHDTSERVASFAELLAGALPGHWTSSHLQSDSQDNLARLTDRIWDLDLIAAHLAERPLQEAGVLHRQDGAQLVVLDNEDEGFLIAAVAPRALPDAAYRAVPEPNGIAFADDPFLCAEQVAGDLLVRYDNALAQARQNALDCIRPSQPDLVVLTWQQDGSVATVPVGDSARAVLVANGFIQDPETGIFRFSGDGTRAQAQTLREIGPLLDAHGISTAVQHPAGGTAPTSKPAPVPPAPTTMTAKLSASAQLVTRWRR
jgi:hypothetical protein